MDGEEFFLNDPNAVLKDLPADMIDQLKPTKRSQIWRASPESMMEKKNGTRLTRKTKHEKRMER